MTGVKPAVFPDVRRAVSLPSGIIVVFKAPAALSCMRLGQNSV